MPAKSAEYRGARQQLLRLQARVALTIAALTDGASVREQRYRQIVAADSTTRASLAHC